MFTVVSDGNNVRL